MTVLPDPATLLAYALACVILAVTPGADMSLWLAKTLSSGRRAGFAAVLGACAGSFVHTGLAAFGLSALIAASPAAFGALKVVGALYLAWLALDAVRRGSALSVDADAPPTSVRRTFWLAVTVNLANPKVVLFFVTFLPQFVQADDPDAVGKLAFLGLFFVVLNLPFAALLVLGAGRVVGALKSRPRLMRGIDWLFAGVFGTFAVRILTTQAR